MPRIAALSLLNSVLDRRRPLDDALEDCDRLKTLESRDRAFARVLTATTLRRLGQIDAILEASLDKPLAKKAEIARPVLRLGITQLLFLGTPAHAAVSTSVELMRAQTGGSHYAAMVNAVLRTIDRKTRKLLDEQDAARLNTPQWLWDSWVRAYGEETTRAIADAHVNEPPLDITVKGDPTAWIEPLGATLLPNGSLRRNLGGDVRDLPGYEDGAWWVQDAAATLPARLLGAVDGRTVIDLCAAPGGKTAELAAAGAQVIAVERAEKRLQRLTQNMQRLGLADRVQAVVANAETWRPETPADAVLLDAPCTATGTLRRHPDAAHLKAPRDVVGLAAAQGRLLRAALQMLKPGGTLIYCVCSLEAEEGPDQIDAVIKEGLARRQPIAADELPGLALAVTPAGDLRTLPHMWGEIGGMDGFFAARLTV